MKINNIAPLNIKNTKTKNQATRNAQVSFQGANPLLTNVKSGGLINKLGNYMKSAKPNLEKFLDFKGFSMTHMFLVLTTFGFVNVPRVIHARTNDERREILWRDYTTVATICFAFPILNKVAATLHRKATGLVGSYNENRKNQNKSMRIKEHLRIFDLDKGDQVFSREGINKLYTNIDKYKIDANIPKDEKGISGFFKYIDKQKGDIKKMLKIDTDLDKPIKEMIAEFEKTGKKFDGSNKSFIEMFKHATSKDGQKNKVFEKGIKALKNAFHEAKPAVDGKKALNNKFVQKALFGTKIMSAVNIFMIIPLFLGLFLPWLNEKITKDKYTDPKKVKTPISKNTIKNINKSRDVHFMNSTSMLNDKQKQIFKDFIKPDKSIKKEFQKG